MKGMVGMSETSLILSRQQRQENMDAILNSLAPKQQDFNTMMIGFADIIQSSFFNFLSSNYIQDKKEHDDMENRINEAVNKVMVVLNESSRSNPEDMVVLSTVMIEAITKALQRQQNAGEVPINKNLNRQ